MHVCFAGAMCLPKVLPHLAIRFLKVIEEFKKQSLLLIKITS